jgi:hypothetical protein
MFSFAYMRRLLPLLCAALAAAVIASPAAARPDDRVPLRASLAACQTGPSEDERFAIFTASMPAYRGTRRMAMRFELLMRPDGRRRWELVRRLGPWIRSAPNKENLVWAKRVERLHQGVEYRVQVRFRWYQVGTARRPDRVRRSPICVQPDQRPDLRLDGVRADRLSDGSWRYTITVVNAGRTSAGRFDVALRTREGTADRRTVPTLPAGERATLELSGPPCSDEPVVVLDAGFDVDESSERNNRSRAGCGAGAGG